MGRWVKVGIFILAVVAICPAQSSAPAKKRVAVLDFDYATVQSGVSAIFGTNVDVGNGVTDLLVTKLVKSGVYSVIERQALEKVLTEQNFSNSDRADPSSAAQLARILGVEAIIIGSITQFGVDEKATNVGGGGFGGRFGLGGVSKKEAKAVVAIDARVISTETAEILAVAQGKGESKRAGGSLIGAHVGGLGAPDMSSSSFADTILGEAVHQAVNAVAQQLDQGADKLPTRMVKVEGLVADATGETLILNVGSKAGVKVGDQLEVRRVTREVKDPATGRVLRRITDKVGVVTVTEVDEASAVGTYAGNGPAQVGDTVQSP